MVLVIDCAIQDCIKWTGLSELNCQLYVTASSFQLMSQQRDLRLLVAILEGSFLLFCYTSTYYCDSESEYHRTAISLVPNIKDEAAITL